MTSPILTISGFSGAGKDTLISELLAKYPDRLQRAVASTTRPPRDTEVHGLDYHFLSNDQFDAQIAQDHFFETIDFSGYRNGSPHPSKLTLLQDQLPIYKIDIRGVLKYQATFPQTKSIFLYIPAHIQRERLEARGTDPEQIALRQAHYQHESELIKAHANQFEILEHSAPEDLEKAMTHIENLLQL